MSALKRVKAHLLKSACLTHFPPMLHFCHNLALAATRTGELFSCSHACTQFLGLSSRIWYYFRLIPNRPDGKYCTLLLCGGLMGMQLYRQTCEVVFLQRLGAQSRCQALPEDERLVRWHCLALCRHLWETDPQERLTVQSLATKNSNGAQSPVNWGLFSKPGEQLHLCFWHGPIPKHTPSTIPHCGLLLFLHFINPLSSHDQWFSTPLQWASKRNLLPCLKVSGKVHLAVQRLGLN